VWLLSYIFALVAVLILLPIILFLKLGLSKKGKIIILSSSLLIAIIALLAQISYPLWQVVLICLLLVVVVTFLLNQRYETLMFETKINPKQTLFVQVSDVLQDLDEDQLFEEEYNQLKNSRLAKEKTVNSSETVDVLNIDVENHEKEVIVEPSEITDYPNEQMKITPVTLETKLEDEMNEIDVNELFKMDEIEIKDTGEKQLYELDEMDFKERDTKQLLELEEIEMIHDFAENNNTKGGNIEIEILNDLEEMDIDFLEEIKLPDINKESQLTYEIESRTKKLDSNTKRNPQIKKENYLSEIEKLLEED
jgi:ABC-type multidrug transport system fused ATPase/permease subunit